MSDRTLPAEGERVLARRTYAAHAMAGILARDECRAVYVNPRTGLWCTNRTGQDDLGRSECMVQQVAKIAFEIAEAMLLEEDRIDRIKVRR